MDENKLSIGKVLENIFISIFKVFSDINSLAKMEAQLAKQSLLRLLFLALIIWTLLTTTWLCLLAFIVVYFVSLQFSLLTSFMVVIAINLVFVSIVLLLMVRMKRNLSFNATQRQLNNTKSMIKDIFHANITRKNKAP